MSLIRRFDTWRPSLTWWALGSALTVFAVADLLDLGNWNRELTILGAIGFVGMLLELKEQRRKSSSERQGKHG